MSKRTGSGSPVKVPTEATLARYGLTQADWWILLRRQGSRCAVCGQTPSSGRFHVDHEHLRGWKKLPPRFRRAYVRGLLCYFCNTMLARHAVTLDRARRLVAYLEKYHERERDGLRGGGQAAGAVPG
jgi:hypothetical protein